MIESTLASLLEGAEPLLPQRARTKRMLFTGRLDPSGGPLPLDRSRLGLGRELRRDQAERYAA